MLRLNNQSSVNKALKDWESRVNFSQLTWAGLVLAAACVGVINGAPWIVAITIGAVLLFPALVWAIWGKQATSATFDEIYVGTWGIVVLFAMALGGGALTPLTVILILGPLATIVIDRPHLAVLSALIGLIAYALTIGAGVMGWSVLVPANWQELCAPLAVAGLVQVVVFTWAMEPRLRSVLDTQLSETGTEMDSAAVAAEGPLSLDAMPAHETDFIAQKRLPVLGLHLAPSGRVKQILGAEGLRWPELKVGSVTDNRLTEGAAYFVAPDGTRFAVARSEADENGTWVCLVPAGEDKQLGKTIANLKAEVETVEKNLVESQEALADRIAFFAGLGHDLKTPLNAILGFADLMKAEVRGPLPDAYKDYPAIIHESGQDLMLLVEDILDLAKADAKGHRLELEPVDLIASGASIVSQLSDQAARANVKLQLKSDGEIWAEADARAVRQIWQNLVSNAIKYSREGGTVTLTAEKAAGAVALSVQDRGIGMSKEDLERVGKPFAQGDNSRGKAGTGLGLAVVYRFANLHGGKVKIDTAEGKGARVRVTLPAAELSEIQGLEDAAQ